MLRRNVLSSSRWHTRATLWGAALLAGLVVVGFTRLGEAALDLFMTLSGNRPWVPFLLGPAVGMVAVWLTQRFFPGIPGSGIPQVIAATHLAANRDGGIGKLVSLRVACGKILVGALVLVGGFSVGREGPSVQIAASILHAAHRVVPQPRAIQPADLILAGGAAGLAAAFNTPLAGIVFAIEELARRFETRTSGVLISSIILSGLVAIALLGDYNYFGRLKVVPQDRSIIFPIVAGGVICGLLGGLFSWLMLWPQRSAGFVLWVWRKKHPVRFAGICGFLVALIGWAGGGLSFGSGYAITEQAVLGQVALPWHAGVTRFLATVISSYSGIPGGIFAPLLAIGGALGSSTAHLWGTVGGAAPIMALFMAGLLAAVTQSPITASIIVMEMVDSHEMVISLMAIAFIAKAVSSQLGPELYHRLALDWYTPRTEPPAPVKPSQSVRTP
jgi:H+/Cl- antiporter ClcA